MAEAYSTEISSNELNTPSDFPPEGDLLGGQIYLAREGAEPIAAFLSAGSSGGHVWLQVTAGDAVSAGRDLLGGVTLTLTRSQFVALVRSLLGRQPSGAPRGVIHAPVTEPEPDYKRFNLVGPEWLNGDPAHDWPLFKARFGGLKDKNGVHVGQQILNVVREYYKAQHQVNVDRLPPADPDVDELRLPEVQLPPTQLERDVALLLSRLDEILNPDGRTINQSAAARVLGIKNAGNYRPDRLLPAVEAIEKQITHKEEAA
jgi:hypothetical protein